MYCVYILKLCNSDSKKLYIGYTANLKNRIKQHKIGHVKSTKNKNPCLIYFEAYTNKYIALKREKGIKSSGSVYTALIKRLEL